MMHILQTKLALFCSTMTQRDRTQRGHIQKTAFKEAWAVALLCAGAMTLLSLASYCPGDISLNASGATEIQNWIGPVGAYLADLLLQSIGVGSWIIGAMWILMGCRAFTGHAIRPGLREFSGFLLLIFSLGLLTQMSYTPSLSNFPPGGFLGALAAESLRTYFAPLGAYVLSISLALMALSLTADGILSGWGLQGVSTARWTGRWLRQRAQQAGRGIRQFLRHLHQHLTQARAKQRSPSLPNPVEGTQNTVWDAPEVSETLSSELLALASARTEALENFAAPMPTEVEQAQYPFEPDTFDVPEHGVSSLRGARNMQLPDYAPSMPQQAVASLTHTQIEQMAAEAAQDLCALPLESARPQRAEALGHMGTDTAGTPWILGVPPPAAEAATQGAPPPAPQAQDGGIEQDSLRIIDAPPPVDKATLDKAAAQPLARPEPLLNYQLPPASLLDYTATVREPVDPAWLRDNAERLAKTLSDYGIEGHVREIRPGPVVTMYEYVPGPGVKISKIASLADDLAMSMEAMRVRIVAPIPGKGAVGIEIPNDTRETVYLKEILAHETFSKAHAPLTMALGKDIAGNACVADLAKMPHLLVAGATGAGKSVSINAMIMSVLFKATPDEVRMLMVDPKMLELSVYEGIPHLLLPVVTDPKKAAQALRWATEEMERRYERLSELGVRGIDGYNKKVRAAKAQGQPLTVRGNSPEAPPQICEPMPYLLVIVDELADLMMVASREVEASIMRLAQMARAAGIHLILATQRPSVDVLTGVIKANFPTRIAFQVASRHDSRTIIDGNGAEHLLGRGDMLYLSPGVGGLKRVHGAYVSEEEIERTVAFVRAQGAPQYDESILAAQVEDGDAAHKLDEDKDEMYDHAVAIVAEMQQASISMIQRRLRIGYNRAARMVERMEAEGIIGPADGAKSREVFISATNV